jgi:hypothetical protein
VVVVVVAVAVVGVGVVCLCLLFVCLLLRYHVSTFHRAVNVVLPKARQSRLPPPPRPILRAACTKMKPTIRRSTNRSHGEAQSCSVAWG